MSRRLRRRSAGFSLIEMVVVVAIMMIAAMMGFPALMNMLHRSKLETMGRQIATTMQVAKLESIKTSRKSIVKIDNGTRTIQAYVNVDESVDLAYNPDNSKPFRTVDYEIRNLELSAGLEFIGPGGAVDRVLDFTTDPNGGDEIAVFLNNGSIEDDGAYRIGDVRGNYLEIRVSPKATARVELRKWDPDDSKWYAQGEGDKSWKWY